MREEDGTRTGRRTRNDVLEGKRRYLFFAFFEREEVEEVEKCYLSQTLSFLLREIKGLPPLLTRFDQKLF